MSIISTTVALHPVDSNLIFYVWTLEMILDEGFMECFIVLL